MSGRDDVYPASVKVGDQRYSRARIFREGDRAVVWAEAPRGLTKVADVEVGEVTKINATRATWSIVGGETWDVMRTGGCGCGSSLRKMSRDEALA